MTETEPPRLFGKPKKVRTIFPLPNWIYHVKAQNPMIGDRGVMTYQALVWKQLWSLITTVAYEHLDKTDITLGYYNMHHLITEKKSLNIARAIRKTVIFSDRAQAYIDFAREKLFRTGQIAGIEESRRMSLTLHMLPVLTIQTVEKLAVFSRESAGFRIC